MFPTTICVRSYSSYVVTTLRIPVALSARTNEHIRSTTSNGGYIYLRRPVPLQSETWMEKTASDRGQKLAFLSSCLFDNRVFDYFSNWTRDSVEKTDFFDRSRQPNSCSGNVSTFRSILVRVSHTHTKARHTTGPHITTSASLAWLLSFLLLFAASQRDTSIYSRRQHVTTLNGYYGAQCRKPFANGCAGCSFGNSRNIQRRDGLGDEMEENAPRGELTRCSRTNRVTCVYVGSGAAAGDLRPLLTPQVIQRTSFDPMYAYSTRFSWI